MAEETSIASYEQCHADGLICQHQLEVVRFIALNESGDGVSQGDVSRYFQDASSSYQPRFRELADSGVIIQSGLKKDPVTRKTVKCYQLTGVLPTTRVKRKAKAQVKLTRQALLEVLRVLQRHDETIPDDAEIVVRVDR
jgi:hypothetical protein